MLTELDLYYENVSNNEKNRGKIAYKVHVVLLCSPGSLGE